MREFIWFTAGIIGGLIVGKLMHENKELKEELHCREKKDHA